MKRRRRILIYATAVVVLVLSLWLVLRRPRREIGRTPNPDGTITVAIGHERLLGLLGIEITYAVLDKDGTTVFSSGVRDECWSWSEARRKHSTPALIIHGSATP